MYVCQLSEQDQQRIADRIRANLLAEGYSESEIMQAIQDAMDSKVSDIE